MDNAVTPFSSTLNVPCKCCGAHALVRHESEGRGQIGAGEQPVSQRLQRTYHCTLCGDAWVSSTTQHANGTHGKWLHIPNWQPHLTRVIELDYHPDNILLEQEDVCQLFGRTSRRRELGLLPGGGDDLPKRVVPPPGREEESNALASRQLSRRSFKGLPPFLFIQDNHYDYELSWL